MSLTVRVVTPSRGQMRVELANFREWLVGTERRYNLDMNYAEAQPIANNRNRIALQQGGADFLLSIDSDTVPLFNPLNCVELDLDVLGFPYPTWRMNDDQPLIWFPDEPKGQGLTEVEEVGAGCLLIARRVFKHPDMRAPFLDEWHEDGRRKVSEDIAFCRRARKAGFRVWCHFDLICEHIKPTGLVSLWRYIQRLRAGERAGVFPPFTPPAPAPMEDR